MYPVSKEVKLHVILTMELDGRVRAMATDVHDSPLLARIAGGGMTGIGRSVAGLFVAISTFR